MKKLTYWIFLIICCNILFLSCGEVEYVNWTHVDLGIKTNLSKAVNIYFTTYDFNDSRHDVNLYNVYPMAEYQFYTCSFVKSTNDFFYSAIVKELRKKRLVITTLAGDTLANWDKNSVVFNEKEYWTIESMGVGKFYCTLNLTDEVLQLK